ncbi:HEAT repeat domain-containing protein [Herbidospora mongoliensis]|uniref:HEAT repeat domain-containing protein n=1 Tax=Herbidospora mongoliensis TaxID=688067 RepID=UPI000835EE61|nr:hypothetical protein [Herbidospora mongoliensis]
MKIEPDLFFKGFVRDAWLERLTPEEWCVLDAGFRSGYHVNEDRHSAFGIRLTLSLADIVVMACSRNGRHRERALAKVARNVDLWPLLVIRSLDWADPVRHHARRLLAEVAVKPGAVDRLLPIAVLLRRRQGGEIEGDDPAPFLRSRMGRVRARALARLPDRAPEFLDDRSRVVRLTAQWAIRQAGGDPALHYRADLAGRVAIEGLGECGDRGDAPLVIPFLRDPRPRTRQAAARTLRNWGVHEELAAYIRDPSARVVAQVVKSMRATGAQVSFDLLDRVNPAHVRRAGHRLLINGDSWTRLRADLLSIGDPDFGDNALSDLDEWCERVAPTLYQPCPEELRRELRSLVRHAPERHRRLLAWVLT